MRKVFGLAGLGLVWLFCSCAAAPLVTEEMIDSKLGNLQLGELSQTAQNKLGIPDFVMLIPKEEDRIEIWGYHMGNYTYSEWGLLLFKNDRLIAVPRSHYELLQFLSLTRVIERAQLIKPLEDAKRQVKQDRMALSGR